MKRIFTILSLLLLITACDDGKLTVDVIDFAEGPILKCSAKDVLYKIKGSEMMVVEIPATTFTENQTLTNAPIIVPIAGDVKVTYRKYSDEVTTLNICPTIPDVTPNLVEQWQATAGTIQIIATAIKTTNADTNFTKITSYVYNITFKNISFLKPGGISQPQENFPFGNYSQSVTPLSFGFDTEVEKSSCSNDNRIFNFSTSEALILNLADYSTLFVNEVTVTPRTALISSTNKLSYRLFSNSIGNDYFCTTPAPANPILLQQWDAVAGVTATSGIIEVTTTTFSPGFKHTIHLKKVTMKKGNSDFTLGDDYEFGSFITPN